MWKLTLLHHLRSSLRELRFSGAATTMAGSSWNSSYYINILDFFLVNHQNIFCQLQVTGLLCDHYNILVIQIELIYLIRINLEDI